MRLITGVITLDIVRGARLRLAMPFMFVIGLFCIVLGLMMAL